MTPRSFVTQLVGISLLAWAMATLLETLPRDAGVPLAALRVAAGGLLVIAGLGLAGMVLIAWRAVRPVPDDDLDDDLAVQDAVDQPT